MAGVQDVKDLKDGLEKCRRELDLKNEKLREMNHLMGNCHHEIGSNHDMIRKLQRTFDEKLEENALGATNPGIGEDCPKYIRIEGPKEVLWRQDPELVQKNRQLAEDLEVAILEEQNAKLRASVLQHELDHWRAKYKELEIIGLEPRRIYIEKETAKARPDPGAGREKLCQSIETALRLSETRHKRTTKQLT
jgi:hypothetical protein